MVGSRYLKLQGLSVWDKRSWNEKNINQKETNIIHNLVWLKQ